MQLLIYCFSNPKHSEMCSQLPCAYFKRIKFPSKGLANCLISLCLKLLIRKEIIFWRCAYCSILKYKLLFVWIVVFRKRFLGLFHLVTSDISSRCATEAYVWNNMTMVCLVWGLLMVFVPCTSSNLIALDYKSKYWFSRWRFLEHLNFLQRDLSAKWAVSSSHVRVCPDMSGTCSVGCLCVYC